MIPADFTKKAQKIFDDAHINGNLDALDELYSPGIVRHTIDRSDLVGIDAIKQYVAGVRRSFGSYRVIFNKAYIAGDIITWQWTFEATHQKTHDRRLVFCDSAGETQIVKITIPAGTKATMEGCVVCRVADGKIVEEWAYYSGLMPSLNAAGVKLTQEGIG